MRVPLNRHGLVDLVDHTVNGTKSISTLSARIFKLSVQEINSGADQSLFKYQDGYLGQFLQLNVNSQLVAYLKINKANLNRCYFSGEYMAC